MLMTHENKTEESKSQEKKERSSLISIFEERSKNYSTKLDELVAKNDGEKAATKAKNQKGINELRKKVKTAERKLDELRAAGDGKWRHFKTYLEALWKDVEVSFNRLAH